VEKFWKGFRLGEKLPKTVKVSGSSKSIEGWEKIERVPCAELDQPKQLARYMIEP
jgi:hypothetical protein